MKIKTITGVSEFDGLTVNKPVVGIIVKANVALANETIEIKRINQHTGDNESICARTKITDLAEIAAQKKGFYVSNAADSLVIIAIANGGLRLDTDKYLELEFGSLNDTKTYEIFGLEDNNLVEKGFAYQRFTIGNGEDLKKYVIGDNELLAIPVTGLVGLKAWAMDGVTMEYTPTELKAIMNLENDVVKTGGATVHGYDKYFLVSIEDIREIEIETDGNTYQFFMIDKK
ncbi:hypothetical protein [Carboxylicivirga sp. M1479]|uniref:hypothetical protein n=1 Tax=Carboxylicivirga sp. M1479 TaxID=2594476 RepID=UPI0011785EBD|nr:hypothetical protein [Carboxylicivirga sp. M1479]TRX70528.1 hypothetical protein FNN09_11155 [Carboxylicivirga sp. M1479]